MRVQRNPCGRVEPCPVKDILRMGRNSFYLDNSNRWNHTQCHWEAEAADRGAAGHTGDLVGEEDGQHAIVGVGAAAEAAILSLHGPGRAGRAQGGASGERRSGPAGTIGRQGQGPWAGWEGSGR